MGGGRGGGGGDLVKNGTESTLETFSFLSFSWRSDYSNVVGGGQIASFKHWYFEKKSGRICFDSFFLLKSTFEI